MESSMSKAGLDNRHRNKDGEISHKHGNTLIHTLRRIYGQSFAAGYPDTEKLSEVLVQLNETSLSQLRRDHETGHVEQKISNASKEKGERGSLRRRHACLEWCHRQTFLTKLRVDRWHSSPICQVFMSCPGSLPQIRACPPAPRCLHLSGLR